jgi:hypothetical protein
MMTAREDARSSALVIGSEGWLTVGVRATLWAPVPVVMATGALRGARRLASGLRSLQITTPNPNRKTS